MSGFEPNIDNIRTALSRAASEILRLEAELQSANEEIIRLKGLIVLCDGDRAELQAEREHADALAEALGHVEGCPGEIKGYCEGCIDAAISLSAHLVRRARRAASHVSAEGEQGS
jgi:hypothetical protein